MAQQDLRSVYLYVVDDVVSKMKPEFVTAGIDECVTVVSCYHKLCLHLNGPLEGQQPMGVRHRLISKTITLCRSVLLTLRERWQARMGERGLLDPPDATRDATM